jgi:hypothetical protein
MTAAAEIHQAWRCEGCGRISNAALRPSSHRRNGERCPGTFAAATIAPDGAVLAPAGADVAPPPAAIEPRLRYRQSRLRAYVSCPRSTVLASEHTTGTIGSSADLGSALHAVIAEILRTLSRAGESQMATEEAVCVMREVTAAGPWVLTAEDYCGTRNLDGTSEQPGLVQMVCSFAQERWLPSRFMAIEKRLSMEILCPDGEVRLLTGTPDLVIADPPDGVVLVDHKSGRGKPPTPTGLPEGEPIRGVDHLSEGGYTQLVIYAALAMHEWPRVKRATLKECNWRWLGPPREATMTRDDLERVIPFIGELMMKVDRGLREGDGSEFAKPRPGKHCDKRCSVARSCPVPVEQRGLGAIDGEDTADAEAQRWAVVKALQPQMRDAIKAFHEGTGYCPQVSDGLVARWKQKANGKGRDFGIFPPAVPNDPAAALADVGIVDDDYIAAWEAELARQTTGAAA